MPAELPRAGDIYWIELDPVLGTEQAGRRPALVLTDLSYHERSSRAVVCPISSKGRDWPFQIVLPTSLKTRGFVLIDQVRAIHRSSRLFTYIESLPSTDLAEVRGRLATLIGIDLQL